MTNVLILSKTKMNNGNCCIGGITIPDGIPVRLLSANGQYFPQTIWLEPRQIISINYVTPSNLVPPHIETIHVTKGTYSQTMPDKETMLDRIDALGFPIWRGGPTVLFQGCLEWQTNGRGYISHSNIPTNSVGFWIPDKDLVLSVDSYGNHLYEYANVGEHFFIKYVGYPNAENTIPAGTLVRVSLAKWWRKDAATEERCYLQLSGWYDFP